jgi:3-hydroxyacyl-CoA dehydrogenase
MTQQEDAVITVEIEDGIAIITINNPPVNAISQAVRQGLKEAIETINSDDSIKAAVIAAHGRTFIAGADVREFGKPPQPPSLPETISAIENSEKPVVAAINGVALGGGLEIALGCHYRIAGPKARVGLPEVTLGLIPGAGGTQRLPRLIGVEAALDLISSGRHAGVEEGFKLGIIDGVTDGENDDIKDFAINFAGKAVGDPLPQISAMETAKPADDFFETQQKKLAGKARGQLSPLMALDAVKAAVELPFEDGIKKEREIFQKLRDSDQAKALRHAFFAERAVSKVPGLENAKPRTLETIAIIGGGTMGAGITVAVLRSGFDVIMIECDADAVARGQANVAKNLDGYVSRGRMTKDQKSDLLERFTATTEYSELSDVDVVIEAVFENLDVKKDVFQKLDAAMKPGAILASNTSYLDLNQIAAFTKRPEDVVGLHFFSPAHVMRLLEIVRGDKTSDDVLSSGFAFAKKLGKVGVLSGVCDGFIGNRILAQMRKQADYMIEDGAMPSDVDKAVEGLGLPMGPFRVMDMAGLDISWAARKRQAPDRDPNERYVAIADRICETGYFGQKTGSGWYVYDNGKYEPNPDAEKIILEESGKKNITRREFAPQEIQDRILYAMINEGAKILAEGIAKRPLDIDMVEVFGYGFPRWRGGPMCTADLIGLPKVLDAIKGFEQEDPAFWKPASLLVNLVETGKDFASLNA